MADRKILHVSLIGEDVETIDDVPEEFSAQVESTFLAVAERTPPGVAIVVLLGHPSTGRIVAISDRAEWASLAFHAGIAGAGESVSFPRRGRS